MSTLGRLNKKLNLPGFDIPLHSALEEIEADRFERTHGTSFFAWPVHFFSYLTSLYQNSSWSLLISVMLGVLLGLWGIDAIPGVWRLRVRQTSKEKMVGLTEGGGVRRVMVRGSEGQLEMLVSEAVGGKGERRPPAVLFVHGGFGGAGVWLPWMRKLHSSKNGYAGNLYDLSLRGHGGSFAPGYLEMVYLTSMTTLSMDVAAAMREIITLEETAGNKGGLVLAGHGSGGGLIQHALASGKLPVRPLSKIGGLVGVALITATPPFGSLGMYWNWFMADPFFLLRWNIHFSHPRSPLSSTKLVRGAFFGETTPAQEITEFEKGMANYESFIWPSQMMFGRYVDVDEVLARMTKKNVFIMAADGDRLMGVRGQRQMAREYANVLRAEDTEEMFTNVHDVRIEAEGTIAGEVKEGGKFGSLQLNLIRGSGHHVMNDVKKDAAAEVFRRWLDSV